MKIKKSVWRFLLLLIFSTTNAFSLEISQKISFSKSSLHFRSRGEVTSVLLANCDLLDRIGEPQLPVKQVYLSIPLGAEIEKVEVSSYEIEKLEGEYSIYPTQPPEILEASDDPSLYPSPHGGGKGWGRNKKINFVQGKKEIYESSKPYPGKLIEYIGTGFLSGYQIAEFLVYPLQYIPAEKRLEFYSKIEFTVHYKLGRKIPQPVRQRSLNSQRLYSQTVKNIVLNRSDAKVGQVSGPASLEYLIITEAPYDTVFLRLADWKKKKGLSSAIRTVNWITANYPGYDTQEKIRNYLKIAHSDSGLTFLLIGGDTNIVPVRLAYAMTCSAFYHPREDSLPCDLYYSDLDGEWDLNANHIYGEVLDSVDLYPDIFVGRASVDSISEVQAFVNKILTYEKNPPLDYQLKTLFAAEILWNDPWTDSSIGKDMIEQESFPQRFSITKLYESKGNETPTSVWNAMNSGPNLINHDGHGSYAVIGVGTGYLNRQDMDTLSNNPKNGILYSIGCWTSAFDFDCIAEHFVNNPNGGGIAYIGNSSYGWGSPGNPGYGYSDRFDARFFDMLFNQNIFKIGMTLANAKAYYISRSREANVYRWHQYDVNLLGDPEMSIWTDVPRTLTVDYPSVIAPGLNQIKLTVHDGLTPVENALVCLWKGSEVYVRDYTSFTGAVNLSISPSTTGTVLLTVTAQNYLPYQGGIFVVDSLAQVTFGRCEINDTIGGNSDGVVNPGETIQMPVILKNFGNKPAFKVSATLTTADSLVTILDNQKNYGNILPGDSALSQGSYRFSVSSQTPNGHTIPFNLQITDSLSNWWTSTIPLIVATPILAYQQHSIQDSAGNNNGIAEPGDTIKIKVKVKNKGIGLAKGVIVGLSTSDTNLTLIDTTATFGNILSDSLGSGEFRLYILPTSSSPHLAVLRLKPETSDGYSFTDSLILTIGQTGFADNMENGVGGWTSGGINDLWHLSTHRSHSGSYSWYCGDEASWQYANNMNSWLLSPPFILGPNSTLSFWRFYGVTIYGVDGLYVEIKKGTVWDTLDFIGSGGALDSILGLQSDWFEERYDLSKYGYGDTAQIRFTFISDTSKTAEGFYLDDVQIGSITEQPTEVEETSVHSSKFVVHSKLYQNAPNPFSSQTAIRYSLSAISHELSAISHTTLKIYNLAGQLVKTLVNEVTPPFPPLVPPERDPAFAVKGRVRVGLGEGYRVRSVVWDGRDESGKPVAPGVYFYRLQAGDFTDTKKMILIR